MKVLKIIYITLLILMAGLAVSSEFGHELLDKTRLLLAELFNDFTKSDQEKRTLANSTKSIKEINFKQQQILQQKYLMAAGNTGMFPEDLDEAEKKSFIQEALSDLYHSDEVGDRELAVLTLSEFSGKEVVDAMHYALNDPDDLVREQAIMQISEWKNKKERSELMLHVLQDNDPDALVLILESISELNDQALIARIRQLLNHPDEEVREASQLALELLD